MKKIIILIIVLLFPLTVHAVEEVDYMIDQYKIEADIKENGNVEVCEYI